MRTRALRWFDVGAPDEYAADSQPRGGITGWLARAWTRQPLPLDIAVYVACFGYAITVALTNQFYDFRIWGNCASIGYGVAALHSVWLVLRGRSRTLRRWWHSRWMGVGAVGALAMVLPLVFLVIRRLTGGAWQHTPFSWSAQPEVWVIERSAKLLLDHGTPYTDISELAGAPGVYDYTPYGPVMAVFGLPDALLGDSPVLSALTDARLYFALAATGCVVAALKLLGSPRVPIRGAQLAVVCPCTALTWAVAGPDLAILGLIVLAFALAARGRIGWSATVIALTVSAKLIALPAVVVLAALVFARHGARACRRFTGAAVLVVVAVNLPVLLVDPDAYLEHVIRFPLGLAEVSSPAASPLPGHLIAGIGPVGHAAALAVLAIAGAAVLTWIARRPPRVASQALTQLAVGLAAFTLLAPATRFGYLVYPAVLLGAMLCFREAERSELVTTDTARAGQAAQRANT